MWISGIRGWFRASHWLAMLAVLACAWPWAEALGGIRHKDAAAPEAVKRPWMEATEPPLMALDVESLGFYPPARSRQHSRAASVATGVDFAASSPHNPSHSSADTPCCARGSPASPVRSPAAERAAQSLADPHPRASPRSPAVRLRPCSVAQTPTAHANWSVAPDRQDPSPARVEARESAERDAT